MLEVREQVRHEAVRRDSELVSFVPEVEVEPFEDRDEGSYARLLGGAGCPREFEVVVREFRVCGPSEVLGEAAETLHRLVDQVGILLLVGSDDEVVEERQEKVCDDLARKVPRLDLVCETTEGASASVVLDVEDVVEPVGFDVAFDEERLHLVELGDPLNLLDRVADHGEHF